VSADAVLLGLGVAEWLTIVGLVGGLLLTFVVMARASVHYEQARRAREQGDAGDAGKDET
jgi:hypothetical protein